MYVCMYVKTPLKNQPSDYFIQRVPTKIGGFRFLPSSGRRGGGGGGCVVQIKNGTSLVVKVVKISGTKSVWSYLYVCHVLPCIQKFHNYVIFIIYLQGFEKL